MNLHNDIVAVADAKQIAEDSKFPQAEPYILEPIPVRESVSEILGKIRLAVYKNGIRTPEYFRDNDGLRSGTVTETQVSGSVGKDGLRSRTVTKYCIADVCD